MTLEALLGSLRRRDVRLTAMGDRLRVSAPAGAIDTGLRDALARHKRELLEILGGGAAPALSFGQERLWFLDQLDPGSPAYNIPLVVEITGPLDPEALARALTEVVRRHETLRTVCRTEGGGPRLELVSASTVPLPVIDLTDMPAATRRARLEELIREDARAPFSLGRAPFLRARLIRTGPEEHVASIVTHHFVADGWSMRVLVQELGTLYEVFIHGAPSPLSPLPLQYAEAALIQRQRLRGERLEAELQWWKARLQDRPAPLELPIARPRAGDRSGKGGRVPILLRAPLPDALRALARKQGGTLFMALLAGFDALLARYTGRADLVVATAVSNRPSLELEPLIGCFANNLLLRTDLSGDPTFTEVLERVRATAVEAYAHQDLPFEKLVEALQPERDLARTPLFEVMLVLENAPPPSIRLADLTLRVLDPDPGTSRFDLTVNVVDGPSDLEGFVEYDADRFDAVAVERMVGHWNALLSAGAARPELRLSELPLLTRGEETTLASWNRARRERGAFRPLAAPIVERATRDPGAIAVEWDGGAIAYGDLVRRASRVAHHIRRRGARTEDRVGVFLDRGPEQVIALLGSVLAGAAYVPLEPDHPNERVAFLLEDSAARLVLTVGSRADRLPRRPGLEIVLLDAQAEELGGEADTPPDVPIEPENAAYLLYTSGSTGRPKGAVNTHAGIVNRLDWMEETFRLTPEDRVGQKTPFGFDVSVWEYFWPLRQGARLVLARPGGHRDPAYLARWIETRGITVVHFVPSMLQAFLEELKPGRCDSLRLVISSGEALARALARRCHEKLRAELHNLYGPTEAAVDVTHGEVRREEEGPVPIGRPIANATLRVLDATLRPVPVGIPGELMIGGVPLARGYHGKPALTADRFIPDPWADAPGERLYRTGDRTRWREDGSIEFLGRLDHQVKIRGVRIELEEVEAALIGHPSIREAAVAVDDSRADAALVGYVVPNEGATPSAADLRRHLLAKLPEPMVPGRFVVLSSIPLGPSGKLDRKALPRGSAVETPRLDSPLPPRTPTEERLATLWCELLEIDRVGASDSFFDLGGHSLMAARLTARIRECFGVELPLRAVFAAPALRDLAGAVDAGAAEGGDLELDVPAASARSDAGGTDAGAALPLSFFQERLWFLDQFDPGTPTLNMMIPIRLRGRLDPRALAGALSVLVSRHEALRTRFESVGGRPVQVVLPASEVPLPMEDLSAHPPGERDAALAQSAAAEAAAPFDLARGPLLRARLVRLEEREHALLLSVHHSAADGWSIAILLEELAGAYAALARGQSPTLEPPPLQYADFAVWQRRRLRGERLERSLAFWRGALEGAPPHLDLPTDFARPPLQTYRGGRVSRALPRDRARKIRALGAASGATLFMTLLAALDVLLHRWSGQDDVVVGAPVAGRPSADLERVVGPFLNTLPLRARLAGNPAFSEVLRRVRAGALDAYAHQDLPFEALLEALAPVRDLARTPVFQVLLNVLNFPAATVRVPDLEMGITGAPDPPSKFDLTIYVSEQEGELRLDLVYNADLFLPERMEELVRQYERLLVEVSERPEARILEIPLITEESRPLLPDSAAWLDASFSGAVHERFAAVARLAPERAAVTGPSGTWTYGELEASGNRLARHLGTLGTRRGDFVAIYARRGPELAWAVLATLKAGAAFLVLDPAYPARRLLDLARLARPAALIRLERAGELPAILKEHIAEAGIPCVDLGARSRSTDPWAAMPVEAPGIPVGADDRACLTFTSGSTGEPRGVIGLHRSLAHFIEWQRGAWGMSEEDRFSMLSGLAHDPLQRDLFTPLQLGAALVVPEEETSGHPAELVEWAEREGVTVMHLTPAMLQLLVEGGGERPRRLDRLRLALVVGDVLTRRDVARLRAMAPGCRCVSLYGATETQRAVGSYLEPDPAPAPDRREPSSPAVREALPLGRGIPDVQLLVVNGAGGLCGIGEVGEIWIRSPHLAQGYLGDEDLTRSRFQPNPFVPDPGDPLDRVYRTGDLGRYRPDGAVEGTGRADRQVKVRGFRIEPAEVEAALRRHPDVRESAVVIREDAPGGPGLVAYYVTVEGRHPPAAALRGFLAERLPEPMLPAAFVEIPRVPLTPNGKLDRAALPHPAGGTSGGYVPPRDALELTLARVWEEVLERGPVGVRDDFFASGGHSLSAVRLLAKVEAVWGVRIALAALFQGPTVERMASLLRERPDRRSRSPLVPIQPAGREPPVFCVHPIGGTVLCYRALAHHLGPEQPFFGLEAPGVEGDRAPLGTVEEMAGLYLETVRARRPRGPYRLAGWSFGGLVAFEMARRLRLDGEEAALVLIDTWPPGSLGALEEPDDEATILHLLSRALGDLSGQPFEVEGERLRALGDREAQLAFVVAEAHRAGALPPDVGVARLRPLFAVISASVEARLRFRPRKLPGSLVLIRPTDAIVPPPDDPSLGWRDLVEDGVDVHEVPGDHYTMIGEPHVRELARRVARGFLPAHEGARR